MNKITFRIGKNAIGKLLFTVFFIFACQIVFGQVSITSLPYSKSDNFDAYNPSSPANATSTIPAGWTFSGAANYRGRATGSGNQGGFYAYGATTAENSLGALTSGGNLYTYTVSFTNNSGSTITSLTLAWDYEQWRYGIQNTSGWNVTGTGQLAANATLNAKDFSGVAGTTAGTTGGLTTSVSSFTLSGLSITNGQSFGLTWVTTDPTGTDNGVSIDNFSISASSVPTAPTVTTTAATSVTTAGATLNGTVDANNLSTNITFEYGTTVSYGTSVAASPSSLSDDTATAVSAAIGSLALNTLYNYRTVGTVSGTPTNGSNITFYTLAATPGVVTVSNPQLTTLAVTVNATTQNSNPSATQYAIQETTGGLYVQANGSLGASAVWQTAATWATVTVTGLANNTTYTFQAKARNGANVETAFGGTASGTTLAPATVDYCNLQFPTSQTIDEGGTFVVYARVYEPGITNSPGEGTAIDAWIGYSATNGTPDGTWTWVPATYFGDDGANNDEYSTTLGAGITPGTYYYVSRFSINGGTFVYGGKNNAIWSSTADSAVLTVNSNLVDFCNVQFPTTINITEGGSQTVFAQVYEPGVTNSGGQGAGISAWIGYSTTNEAPNNSWTWISATYNTDSGNNDEYQATLGTGLAPGTYYYASRFQKTGSTQYQYGDINGVWNSTADNGVMTIAALLAPDATASTGVDSDSFFANWLAVSGATGYRLDVSTSPTFGTSSSGSSSEGFETGLSTSYITTPTATTLSSGVWTLTNVIRTSTVVNSGTYGAQLRTNNDGVMISPNVPYMSTVTFYARRNGTSGSSGIAVYKIVNSVETLIQNITLPAGASSHTQYTINVNESTSTDVKFKIVNTGANIANIDDVVINYSSNIPSFVPGYENLNVGNVTTYQVTGLAPETLYFYRVRAVNGAVTSGNSDLESAFTLPAAVTWNGTAWSNVAGPDASIDAIIAGVYNTTTHGGFTAKNLTIESGSLTVGYNGVVTVAEGLFNELTAADVVVESNGVLMQDGATNLNTGAITVRRNSSAILRQDYTAWSSPVANQGLYAFSPTTLPNRFYVYNTGTNQYSNAVGFDLTGLQYPSPLVAPNGINGTDLNAVPFENAKGYLIRTPWNHPTAPASFAGQFVGIPNSGEITYTMSLAGTGFNLVGNPYPSPIDMNTFVDDNAANITTSLYFWRETNGNTSNNAYCQWNDGVYLDNGQPTTVTNPNSVIRTGQGFFVEATGVGTALLFTNDQRIADVNNQFFRQNNAQSVYWLNLTNASGVFSQTAVSYKDYATNGIDRYDGKNAGEPTASLTSTVDGQEFGIQGKAAFVDTDVVPMNLKVETAGNYSIAIDHAIGVFNAGQTIYLKDNLVSSLHNLTQGAYNFTSEAGTFGTRFEVVYRDGALNVDTPVLTEKQVVIYKNQSNDFVINTGNFEMSAVKVFDIRGRLLVERQAINATQTTISVGLSNEVLLVQITTVDGAVVTKKVIR